MVITWNQNTKASYAWKNIKKETTVYFDEFMFPHIYANKFQDAMEILGYVHAQDRLWQMELMYV
jgi:penicillin amidase